eukprot:3815050-Rhodomonas_salina.1
MEIRVSPEPVSGTVTILGEVPARLRVLQVHEPPRVRLGIFRQPLQQCIIDHVQALDVHNPREFGKLADDGQVHAGVVLCSCERVVAKIAHLHDGPKVFHLRQSPAPYDMDAVQVVFSSAEGKECLRDVQGIPHNVLCSDVLRQCCGQTVRDDEEIQVAAHGLLFLCLECVAKERDNRACQPVLKLVREPMLRVQGQRRPNQVRHPAQQLFPVGEELDVNAVRRRPWLRLVGLREATSGRF